MPRDYYLSTFQDSAASETRHFGDGGGAEARSGCREDAIDTPIMSDSRRFARGAAGRFAREMRATDITITRRITRAIDATR